MLKHQQPESIEDYTKQLRKRLNGVLPPEKIEEIAQETQMHLADKAEELRNNPDIYERQAVVRFTPVRRYSYGFIRAWSVAYARHRGTKFLQNLSLIGVSSVMLLLIANVVLASKIPDLQFSWGFHGQTILFFALIGTFILALFASRHQLKRMIYFCIATSTIVFLSYGFLCSSAYQPFEPLVLSPFNNNAVLSRLDTGKQYKFAHAQYNNARSKILNIDKEINTFKSNNNLPSINSNRTVQLIQDDIQNTKALLSRWTMKKDSMVSQNLKNRMDVRIGRSYTEIAKKEKDIAVIEKLLHLIRVKNQLGQELGSWTYTMNAQIALMARPRGSFDWGVARSAAGATLFYTGFLLIADLVGGWLGMLCLQAARRWRNRSRDMKTPPVVRG
jgi:hypothetical protein